MATTIAQQVKTETTKISEKETKKPVIIETKKKVVSLILTHQARIRCLLDMIIKGKRTEKKEGFIGKIIKNRKLNNSINALRNTINKAQTYLQNKFISNDNDKYEALLYDYIKKEEEVEIRFKNCSLLRLCVNKETGLCLQLVYGGELDPGEGKGGRTYYVVEEEVSTNNVDENNGDKNNGDKNNVDENKQFGGAYYDDEKKNRKMSQKILGAFNKKIKNVSQLGDNFVSASSLIKKKEEEINDTKIVINEENFQNINAGINRLELPEKIFKDVDEYVFYIGRHGQAQHNLDAVSELKKANLRQAAHQITDTDVTNLGKEQAFRAGENLTKILKKNKENINYVFASDLMRTRQTIENILKGMNSSGGNDFFFPKEIIILPCSHELKFNSKGLCDKKPSVLSFNNVFTRENNPKCSKTTHCIENNITNPDSDCNRIQIIDEDSKNKIVRKIPLQWDFYFEKNENKMRKMDCSKTNMIKLAIEYINTSGPIKFNQNVVIPIPIKASDGPSPPKETLNINDQCLIECFKKVFKIGSEIDDFTLKAHENFQNISEYFQGVKTIGDLKNKTYDEFIKRYNYTHDVTNKFKNIFDQFVQCLSETCLEKNNEKEKILHQDQSNNNNNNPPRPPPPPPPPQDKSNNNIPPREKPKKVFENQNNKMNSVLYWTNGFETHSEYFYKNIRDISIKNINFFDKVMDEIIKTPEKFYKMIDTYLKTEDKKKDTNITFIKDYLFYRLKYNDENAVKFMKYIETKDENLYNSILNYKTWYDNKGSKQKGGKKTRKNRKGKKRFLKRTKRNHKKSKTRRIRRKII